MPEMSTSPAPASPSDPVYLQRERDEETHRLLTATTAESIVQLRGLLTICERRTSLEVSTEGNRQ